MHDLIGDQAMWLGAWMVLSSDYYVSRTHINNFTSTYEEKSRKEISSVLARETRILGRVLDPYPSFAIDPQKYK